MAAMPRSFVSLLLKPGLLVAGPAESQAVAEREGDLALALLEKRQVFHRCFGRLDGRTAALELVGIDLRERDPKRVVHAGRAARQNIDELLSLGGQAAAAQSKGGGDAQKAARECGTHG